MKITAYEYSQKYEDFMLELIDRRAKYATRLQRVGKKERTNKDTI